jgi:hypothetical protein
LDLPSSPHHDILQDIFGRLAFHARSNLVTFNINRKGGGLSELSVHAAEHLHGKPLSRFMGIREEAFVRFVLIVDIFRYHYDDIPLYAEKYKYILGDSSYDTIVGAVGEYAGTAKLTKVEKGYRNNHIKFFERLRLLVSEERRLGKDLFVFNYPHACTSKVKTEVKEESKLHSKLSKGHTHSSLGATTTSQEELGMPLDDDDGIYCVGVGV